MVVCGAIRKDAQASLKATHQDSIKAVYLSPNWLVYRILFKKPFGFWEVCRCAKSDRLELEYYAAIQTRCKTSSYRSQLQPNMQPIPVQILRRLRFEVESYVSRERAV
jgi:hypothetical protein